MLQNFKNSPFPWLTIWLIVNLLQATFTELGHDEAYYWFWSQNLDWGFFEQPPGVALLGASGYAIFKNELGVRLIPVLLGTCTLWMWWKLAAPKNIPLFFCVVFSMAIVNFGGFFLAPDSGLVFEVSLALILIRHILNLEGQGKSSKISGILPGILIATMAWTKYHSVILLLPILGSNLIWFRKLWFYISVTIALILFLPHLIWQYQHDFVTLRFHFYDRSLEDWSINYVLQFIPGQLLVWGPLVSLPVFILAFLRIPANSFERSLKTAFIAVLLFFFLLSFQTRVEANWTASALIPGVILASKEWECRQIWSKWILRMSLISIPILLLCRLYLVWDFLPVGLKLRTEFHGDKARSLDIEKVAKDLPVLMPNDYHSTTKYMFYTGRFAHSLNTSSYSGNEFDLMWERETSFQNTEVMLISNWLHQPDSFYTSDGKVIYFQKIKNFHSWNRIRLIPELPDFRQKTADSVPILLKLFNPTSERVEFTPDPINTCSICFDWYLGKRSLGIQCEIGSRRKFWLNSGADTILQTYLKIPHEPGHYRLRYLIRTGNYFHGNNSMFYHVNLLHK